MDVSPLIMVAHDGSCIFSLCHCSGYTYMAVWVGGLEVWEIRVMCKIDLKKEFVLFLCFVFVCFFCLFN